MTGGNYRGFTRALLLGCAPIVLCTANAANAQSDVARSAEAGADAQSPGDIVVTAQKRSENLQNVPLAVNVVTAQALAANSIRTFSDLTRAAPSLIIRPAESPVNSSVSIRGIGTYAFSPGVEPSVAVVLDDVPLIFLSRAFSDLSDIERIEVLRGPQSTLYGKSASAGLINIVTPAPSKTLTAKMGALLTTDDEVQVRGTLSGPLSSTLGFRSSLNYNTFEGNVHNLFDGRLVNGRRIFSMRNKLQWEPSSDVTVIAGLDYVKGKTTTGRPFFNVSPNANLQNNAAFPPSVWGSGITFDRNNRSVINNQVTSTRYRDLAQSLRISWDTGGPTLMSISSHDKFHMDDIVDHDDTGVTTYDNRQGGTFDSEQWSQELRLVSPSQQKLRYTAGLFFADVNFLRDFTRGPAFSLARWQSTNESRQYAAFGQLEFDLLPHTTMIAGGRVANEKVSYTFRDILNGNAFFSGDHANTFGTYKVAVQQHVGDDIMLFASYATGYKGEAYDLSTGFNAQRALVSPVKPETSTDFELGARTQFLDRRVTVNVTLFNANYKNFQAQGIETFPDGTVNFRLANVGKVRTRGVEVETSARISPDFSIGAAVTYNDAIITDFPLAQCYGGQTTALGCIPAAGTIPAHQNLAGARPPQAPEWKLNLNFDYAHDLGSLPFQIAASGAYSYQSTTNFTLAQDPEAVQKGYGIANFSLGIRSKDRGYEIMAFLNNAFNTHYYEFVNNARGSFGGQVATQGYIPRDFARYGGIRASVSF